jgi:hypothetical protein
MRSLLATGFVATALVGFFGSRMPEEIVRYRDGQTVLDVDDPNNPSSIYGMARRNRCVLGHGASIVFDLPDGEYTWSDVFHAENVSGHFVNGSPVIRGNPGDPSKCVISATNDNVEVLLDNTAIRFEGVTFSGFHQAIRLINSGRMIMRNCVITDCTNGVRLEGASYADLNGCSISVNGGHGLVIYGNSYASISNGSMSGASHGIFAGMNSFIRAENATANDCNYGFYAWLNSHVYAEDATARNCEQAFRATEASVVRARRRRTIDCAQEAVTENRGVIEF